MIRVGTCGYQHRDWVPAFYPGTLDPGLWLRYYSRRFSCCELGFTSYRIPESQAIVQLLEGSGGRVQFVFRVPSVLLEPEPRREAADRFASAVWPLRDSGQLAGVLARFAASFAFNRENFARLRLVRDLLAGMRLIAEFACPDWSTASAVRHLAAEEIVLAGVDGSGDVSRGTASPAYVRLDGRKQSRWLPGDGSTRHDYLYTETELLGVVTGIRRLEHEIGSVLVLMNNAWRGQAAVNALMMLELLRNADRC